MRGVESSRHNYVTKKLDERTKVSMSNAGPTGKHADVSSGGEKPVNRGRHAAECRICAHANRLEIEQEFVGWAGANRIATTYGVSRDGGSNTFGGA